MTVLRSRYVETVAVDAEWNPKSHAIYSIDNSNHVCFHFRASEDFPQMIMVSMMDSFNGYTESPLDFFDSCQTPATSGLTSKFQSISPSSPYLCFNHSFVLRKCPHSKKPLAALNGLGCTLVSIQCRCLSTFATRLCAGLPHARKTTPCVRCLATMSMHFCVNFSQPLLACELASWARTVRQVLSRSTPRSAQGVNRPPLFGGGWKVAGYSFWRSL